MKIILISILLLLLICLISAWDEQGLVEAIRQKIALNPGYNSRSDAENFDEIFNGPRDKDKEKQKRQAGCMCVARFIDPHCGTDMKVYDNGCFFLCAQERDPNLRLKRWGDCSSSAPSGYIEVVL